MAHMKSMRLPPSAEGEGLPNHLGGPKDQFGARAHPCTALLLTIAK